MSAIFRRLAASDDRLPVHALRATLQLYALGEATRPQARTLLEDELRNPLTGAEASDLAALADLIDAELTEPVKMMKALEIESYAMFAQHGSSLVTESVFDTRLGLS